MLQRQELNVCHHITQYLTLPVNPEVNSEEMFPHKTVFSCG